MHLRCTMNPLSALQHFKCGNAIEIHNRIMFDFCPKLPHIYLSPLCFVAVTPMGCMWLIKKNLVQLFMHAGLMTVIEESHD